MFRSMRAKIGAAVTTAALIATAGCGGTGFEAETEPQNSSGGGEVRMLVNITSNLTKSYWEELVAPFEESHPGVDVVIEAPSGQGVKDTLPQLLAAGNAPDVVETLMVDEKLAPQMLELTDQDWVQETPLVEQAALDGKIYTVGVGMQAQSLVFYNAEAFDKAGISQPPETLTEFEDAMAKLKKADYLPLQTAGDYVTGLQLLQLSDPPVAGEYPDWHQQVADGSVTVGDSMLPLLQRYQSWIEQGWIDENALGLDPAGAESNFLDGKAGMYVMGSWFVRTAEDTDTDFTVQAFPAPVEAGQPTPGPQGVTMAAPYMILKSSKQQQLATELVQWLVTDKAAVQSQLAQDGNFREGFTDELGPLGQEVQQILDEAPAHVAQGEGYGSATLPAGFNTEWNKLVQGLYTGSSPEDVASDIDSWVESNK